jgi:hypothetical protein
MYADKLETQELVIKHPDNPDASIVATAHKDGVGLWLTYGKRVVSVYNLKDQVAIGIYADKDSSSGLNIALSVDDNGEPEIQLINVKGEGKVLGFKDFQNK